MGARLSCAMSCEISQRVSPSSEILDDPSIVDSTELKMVGVARAIATMVDVRKSLKLGREERGVESLTGRVQWTVANLSRGQGRLEHNGLGRLEVRLYRIHNVIPVPHGRKSVVSTPSV